MCASAGQVADAGNHQIVLLEDDGTETLRFGDGQPGFSDGAAGSARFDARKALRMQRRRHPRR